MELMTIRPPEGGHECFPVPLVSHRRPAATDIRQVKQRVDFSAVAGNDDRVEERGVWNRLRLAITKPVFGSMLGWTDAVLLGRKVSFCRLSRGGRHSRDRTVSGSPLVTTTSVHGEVAPIDREEDPGHHGGSLRGEEEHRAHDFMGLA